MIKQRHLEEQAFATFREQPTTKLFICYGAFHELLHTHILTDIKTFTTGCLCGSVRDGQIPGGKHTLLSISLLPREVWMTKSSVSVSPSHSLIRRRASSPAELTFLGEREAQVSDECIKSRRFNHTGEDSLRGYNLLYHCDKQNANASHFTSHSNKSLQTSHLWHVLIYESSGGETLTPLDIWLFILDSITVGEKEMDIGIISVG